MIQSILDSLAGISDFVAYFVLTVVLLGVFLRCYMWLTPHDEMALVRENNVAAAVALSGALLGFAVPLAAAITHSLDLLDCALWGLVAMAVQALTFVVLRLSISQLPQRIAKGEVATAIVTASVSISIGLLNSAAMTY